VSSKKPAIVGTLAFVAVWILVVVASNALQSWRNEHDPVQVHLRDELRGLSADVPFVPRGDVKLVTHGGPKTAVRTFRTPLSGEEVARYFTARFERKGWVLFRSESGNDPNPAYYFCKDGETLVLSTVRSSDETSISIHLSITYPPPCAAGSDAVPE
jgi:hypothetical protein